MCYGFSLQSVVVSDVIVLYVLKKRLFYRQNKYQDVRDSDIENDYHIIDSPTEDKGGHIIDSPTEEGPTSSGETRPINRRPDAETVSLCFCPRYFCLECSFLVTVVQMRPMIIMTMFLVCDYFFLQKKLTNYSSYSETPLKSDNF